MVNTGLGIQRSMIERTMCNFALFLRRDGLLILMSKAFSTRLSRENIDVCNSALQGFA